MKISHCLHALMFLAFSLMWSAFAGAAVVNKVYTGLQPMTAATMNVALGTPVVTAKSFVICQIQTGASGSNMSERATCDLTGPSTLQIQVGATDPAPAENVRWYVVEFLSGVTVQRNTTTLPVGTTSVNAPALTAVNLQQTFVLISERNTTAGQNAAQDRDEEACIRAQLTSNTTLQLTRSDAASTAIVVAWQVIEIQSAFVQSGLATIAAASTSIGVNLSIGGLFPVDAGRTFLVFTRRGGAAIGGDETFYQVRGDMTVVGTTGTALTFTRGRSAANTQIDISWFLVRMTDSTAAVQRGTATPAGATTATVDVALANNPGLVGVATQRSIPFLSVLDLAGAASTADLDDTSWAGTFTTPSNLRLTKTGNNNVNSSIGWQVVQFGDTPSPIDGDGREIF